MFHFYLSESIPNVTDIIQALCAVGILVLTTIMACYAKKALNTWRDQDNHQLQTDLMKSLKSSFQILVDLRNPFSGNIDHEAQEYVDASPETFQHLVKKYVRLNDKIKKYDSAISEFGIKYILAMSQLPVQNPLRLYYEFVDMTVDDIIIKAKSFKFTVDSMDSALREFRESNTHLQNLERMSDESFKDSDFFYNFLSLEEAKQRTAERHAISKERWETILSNVKEYEKVIFRSIFLNESDKIHAELTTLYDNAKKYCANYSNPKNNL